MRLDRTYIGELPARVYERMGLTIVIPFALVTALCIMLLPRLSFTSAYEDLLPKGDPLVGEQRAFYAHFAEPSYVTLLFHGNPLFSAQTLQRAALLQKRLESYPEVMSVLSATGVKDASFRGDELSFAPLYDPGAMRDGGATAGYRLSTQDAIAGFRTKILETPLFRKFLLSKDGQSFALYVFPRKNADPGTVARDVEQAISQTTGDGYDAVAVGGPIFVYHVQRAAARELAILGTISLAIVLLLELLYSRSFAVGAVLLLSSVVPTLWSVALFPLLRIPIGMDTAIVPLMVIALSTSYGIHLYRHLAGAGSGLGAPDTAEAVRAIAPVTIAAGLTTAFGFASLILTPIATLRTLGLLMLPGILFSMLTAIFLLPPLMDAAVRPRRAVPRTASSTTRDGDSRPLFVLSTFGICALILSLGVARVHFDPGTGGYFRAPTPMGRMTRLYEERNGGTKELAVSIDTGRDYGLVDPAVYRGVRAVASSLEALPGHPNVLAYTDLVDWIESRINSGGSPPEGTVLGASEIGEDLELLFSSQNGLRIDSLVDPGYRLARLIVHFGGSIPSDPSAPSALSRIESAAMATAKATLPPTTRVRLLGQAELDARSLKYLLRSQVYSILCFFGGLSIALLLLFRSLRWAALILLPPLAGILFFFGMHGWLGISFTPVTVFMVSAVMGIGNDDVLFFVLRLRKELAHNDIGPALEAARRRTGRAIVQTTVLLSVCLCTFGFSQFIDTSREGPLAAATLAVCTAVTYWVVPAFLRAGKSSRERHRREPDAHHGGDDQPVLAR